jgi:hypothetical protein
MDKYIEKNNINFEKFNSSDILEKNNINKDESLEDINQEKYIENSEMINYSTLKNVINSGLEKCICKIKIDLNDNYYKLGTGFFCQLDNNIKLLLTNNHIINEIFLNSKKDLEIEIDNTTIIINLSIPRFKYTNKEFDFTIIEIIQQDNILHFLSLDNSENINFENKQIFSLHYPKGKNLMFSFGKIKEMVDYKLFYSFSTDTGSSGCPIILFDNKKAIGIHFGYDNNNYFNQGISMIKIIKESEVIKKAFRNFYSINWEKTNNTFNIPISNIKNKNHFEIKIIIENNGNLNFSNDIILKSENSEDFEVSKKIKEEFNINKNLEFNAKVKIKNYNSIVDQEKEFKLSLVIMFSKKDIEIRNNKYEIKISFIQEKNFEEIPLENIEEIKKILQLEYNIYLELGDIKEIIKKKNLHKEKLTPKFNYDISYKIWKILGNK